MAIDLPLFAAWPLFCGFIALPAAAALHRRRRSREASDVATELAGFAAAVRQADRLLPMDEVLLARIARLRMPEMVSLELAQELQNASPPTLADAAQRLSLRLRRRVAFERKMLARTAPGLRRGALAASLPPLLIAGLQWSGAHFPAGAQIGLLAIEAVGCALLWRLARVEI